MTLNCDGCEVTPEDAPWAKVQMVMSKGKSQIDRPASMIWWALMVLIGKTLRESHSFSFTSLTKLPYIELVLLMRGMWTLKLGLSKITNYVFGNCSSIKNNMVLQAADDQEKERAKKKQKAYEMMAMQARAGQNYHLLLHLTHSKLGEREEPNVTFWRCIMHDNHNQQ